MWKREREGDGGWEILKINKVKVGLHKVGYFYKRI